MYHKISRLLVLMMVLTGCCQADSSQDCYCAEDFAEGLNGPLVLKSPPSEDDHRIFIAEQQGHILLYKNGIRQETAFLDVTDTVLTSNAPVEERGFLGFEFHPNFKDNHFVFVVMSVVFDAKHHQEISRFTVKEEDPDQIDLSSQQVITRFLHESNRSIGGDLFFGTDGYLYITIGDENDQSQNTDNVYGSILRIDVDSFNADEAYSIPSDNPFTGNPIYAYGFTNPWRCGVDPGDVDGSGKGTIICGDVGNSHYEEINIIKKGRNYGAPLKEGPDCNPEQDCTTLKDDVEPVFFYENDRSAFSAVIGGRFYRGTANPSLDGKFILGDILGDVWSLTNTNSKWTPTKLSFCDNCGDHKLSASTAPYLLSFGQDHEGELYILSASNLQGLADGGGKAQKLVILSDYISAADHTGCHMTSLMTLSAIISLIIYL